MRTRVRAWTAGLAAAASALAVAAAFGGIQAAQARIVVPAKPVGYTAPTRVLTQGASGADVLALQHRLAALHYWVPAFTGTLSYDNVESLYAFQAVNGLAMSGKVDAATGQALVNPRSYQPRDTKVATRIEVDINTNKQLLVYYKNNAIALISHVSTGQVGHATTPTGTYTANIFMPGKIVVTLGVMYNPVFFTVNGRTTVYAIHGDTQVPSYPDSHGCVRIPLDLSYVFYKMINIVDRNGTGTQIYIYGTNWQTGS
jgi:peptidoglycan hydrolase-like protein with peptidoglycan-binding domain